MPALTQTGAQAESVDRKHSSRPKTIDPRLWRMVFVLCCLSGISYLLARHLAKPHPAILPPQPAPSASDAGSTSQVSSHPASHLLTQGTDRQPQFSTTIKRIGNKAFLVDGSVTAPDGEARGVVQRLEPAARAGDSHSALLIALKLMDCHEIIAHQDDENSLIADAQRLGGLEKALQRRSERHADCASLDLQDYEHRGEWLALAASGGNINAQLLYASAADVVLGSPAMMLKHPEKVIAYKHQALAYLRNAAANGSVDALSDLAEIHQTGILAPADKSRSYAYYLAAERAQPTQSQGRQIALLEGELSASERSAGLSMSKEIYDECCK